LGELENLGELGGENKKTLGPICGETVIARVTKLKLGMLLGSVYRRAEFDGNN
jgi:hypothetical protein